MNGLDTLYPMIGEIAHMGVVTTDSHTSVAEAIELMLKENLLNVIFEVDGEHRIFAVGDLLHHLSHSHDYTTPLVDLPQHVLVKKSAKANIVDIVPLLDSCNDRYIGVIDDDQLLVGVVSYSDVLHSLDPSYFVQHKKIKEVIRSNYGTVVHPETLTRDILTNLINAESAVVIAKEAKPVGIITSRDALRIVRDAKDLDLPVTAHMSQPVQTISESLSISQVLEYMQGTGHKRAVVVDKRGVYLGIVTQSEMSNYTFEYWTRLVTQKNMDLVEIAETLEATAYTDPLTKIGNRRKFNHASNTELLRLKQNLLNTFSLILIDVDHFKKINDQHGHNKGDEVLQALAELIRSLLRGGDTFCRWGGEEFIVLLPDAPLEGAQLLAERIRTQVDQYEHAGISFTVSAGVGEYKEDESIDSVLSRVDQALYQAKNSGRNRVELSH